MNPNTDDTLSVPMTSDVFYAERVCSLQEEAADCGALPTDLVAHGPIAANALGDNAESSVREDVDRHVRVDRLVRDSDVTLASNDVPGVVCGWVWARVWVRECERAGVCLCAWAGGRVRARANTTCVPCVGAFGWVHRCTWACGCM